MNYRKSLLLFFSVTITFLFMLGILFVTKNNKFNLEDINVIVHKDRYDMRISYPKFNNKIFNKKIHKILDKEKEEFINNVKEDESIHDFKYDFIISYNYLVFNDVYSIHFKILKFTGGAHYERKDILFYYDKIKNEEIFIEDLINNKELFYNTLRKESKKYLLDNKEYLEIYDDETLLEDGLNNLEMVSFGEDFAWVIFPPYSVGPWSSGEILVPIKYEVINRYLNSSYFLGRDSSDNTGEIQNNSDAVQAVVRDEEYYKDKKLVALTFDDGPSWDKTEKLLDGLKERDVKVSFFMLGSRIKGQEALVRRIYEEGHTIGSHSYEHKNFHNTELIEAMEDINKTNQMIKDITGVLPNYLRPPYGNYSKELLEETDMTFILWNVDSLDWKKKNSDKIAQYIIDTVQDGDIVLLHDLYDTSIEGAFKAIDELSKDGYAFVSLDELIKIKGVPVEKHKAYRYFR